MQGADTQMIEKDRQHCTLTAGWKIRTGPDGDSKTNISDPTPLGRYACPLRTAHCHLRTGSG